MAFMYFVCECGGKQLEEVMDQCVISSEMSSIHPDGEVEYDEQTNHYGEVQRYECSTCSKAITDADGDNITDPEELFNWLKSRGMLKEETVATTSKEQPGQQ